MRRRISKTQEVPRVKSTTEVQNEQKVKRQPCSYKMFTCDKQFFLKILTKYSMFTWSTWIVLKLFIKFSAYSVLKSSNREEEAHKWITDWGPLANPFIQYIFYPSYKVVMYFLHHEEPIFEDIYETSITYLDNCLIKIIPDTLLCILQDITVKILIFKITIHRAMFSIHFGIFMLIVLVGLSCKEIFCYYRKITEKKRKQELNFLLEELELLIKRSRIKEGNQTTYKENKPVNNRYALKDQTNKTDVAPVVLPRPDERVQPAKPPPTHTCWHCNKPGMSLQKCSVCRKARYCGESCQLGDWERHKEWCKDKGERRAEKKKQRKKIESFLKMEINRYDEVD